MLNVLYVAYRHDPTDPDLSSGADYQFYRAISSRGVKVTILGPFTSTPHPAEEIFRRLYHSATGKKYAKFPLSLAWRVSQKLNQAISKQRPDVVFTLFPPALTFYTGTVPCIYRQDTCFFGWQKQYPEFGSLGYAISMWSEKRVFARTACILTHSQWNRDILTKQYDLPSQKIQVIPNPAALPDYVIPSREHFDFEKRLVSPLRLLFVGRDPVRKGEDIALEIVQLLNSKNQITNLTICGLIQKKQAPHVDYVGPYKKSNPKELQQYVNLYKQAHLLLHPARFDPSPIVTAEAAAFGVPTITNAAGGLATSVQEGISGIVLPKDSLAETYTQKIMELVNDPERYYKLRQTTRQRYENELNWQLAGDRLMEILEQVAEEHKGNS